MSRWLKIVLLIGVVLAALALGTALYFASIWKTWVREQLDERLRAEVTLADVDVSSWYPTLELTLEAPVVVGIEAPFVGDTLFAAESVTLGFDLKKALFERRYELQTLAVRRGGVFLHSIGEQANWDIVKTDGTVEETAADEDKAAFSLRMEGLAFEDVSVRYLDETGRMEAVVEHVQLTGGGRYAGDSLVMRLKGVLPALTYRMDGIAYLSRARVDYEGALAYHLNNATFRFPNQRIRLNALPLTADGAVVLGDTTIGIDLDLRAADADLKKLLSLVPTIYRKDYRSLQASGTAAFRFVMHGTYSERLFPHTRIEARIRNGRMAYPDLPDPVEALNLRLSANNEGPTTERWAIDIPQLAFRMKGDPFSLKLRMKDDRFATSAHGVLHIESWKELLQLDSLFPVLQGTLTANLDGAAALADIDNERWDRIRWEGALQAQALKVQQAGDPIVWEVPTAVLRASPQWFEMSQTTVRWGRSTLHLQGHIENPVGYVMDKAPLKGHLQATSPYLNLNPFITETADEQAAAASDGATDTAFTAPRLPDDLDLTFSMQARQLVYQDWTMDDFTGTVTLREGTLSVSPVQVRWLKGRLTLNGHYRYGDGDARPTTEWQWAGQHVELAALGNAFEVTRRFAPILRYLKGFVNTDARIQLAMDDHLNVQLPTVQSAGRLVIPQAVLEGFPLWKQVARTIQRPDLQRATLQKVHLAYTITDGKAEVKPFQFQINHYPATAYGTYALDGQMDFTVEMQVPAAEVKQLVRKVLPAVNLDILGNEPLTLVTHIKGTADKPRITPSIKEVSTLKDRLRQKGQDFIDQQKQQAQQRLEEEKRKAEEELRKKREELERKAREEAERKKKELEEQARRKLEEEKRKAKEKAKKKAGDMLNQWLNPGSKP